MHRAGIAAALALALAAAADAHEIGPPPGAPVVTVTGDITHANRDSIDPFVDRLFGARGESFPEGVELDLTFLGRMEQRRRTVRYPSWPRPVTVEGPLLSEVIAAADPTGSVVVAYSLGGTTTAIPLEEIRRHPIILAIRADDRFLGIGGRGPTWIVYPWDDPAMASRPEPAGLWGIYRLDVR